MKECRTCKHWRNPQYGFGECRKILEKVEIAVESGFDGHYIRGVETEDNFGCNLWEE